MEFVFLLSEQLYKEWLFCRSKELSPFADIVTLKSSGDRDRASSNAVGFSISNFILGCRLFMVLWNLFVFSSLVVWR